MLYKCVGVTYQSFQRNQICWDQNHKFLFFLIRLDIRQYLDMDHVILVMSHNIRLRRNQSSSLHFHIHVCLRLWVHWSQSKWPDQLDWYFHIDLLDNDPLKKRSLFISRSCFSNLTHRWSGYIMTIQRDSHSVTQLGFKLTHLEIILEISLVTFRVTKMTISYHKWIPLLPSYIFGPIRFDLS